MKTLPLTMLFCLLSFVDANACSRCGNYRSCRYYSTPVYAKPAVASVVNTYVIQNNGGSTIPAGNTLYRASFQASAFPYFDRNAYLAGVNEVHKGVTAGLNLSMTRADTLAQSFAAVDGPIARVQANAAAYEQTLNALGVNLNTAGAPQSSAVVINRDAAGRVQIFKLDEQQINRLNATGDYRAQAQSTAWPMLTQFCAKCHSPDLPQPKGGMYVGDHETVASTMRARFFNIVDLVTNGQMPPPGEPQPTKEQKAALLSEVQAIVKKHAAAPQNVPPPPVPDGSGT